jgi:hypothetical protein
VNEDSLLGKIIEYRGETKYTIYGNDYYIKTCVMRTSVNYNVHVYRAYFLSRDGKKVAIHSGWFNLHKSAEAEAKRFFEEVKAG